MTLKEKLARIFILMSVIKFDRADSPAAEAWECALVTPSEKGQFSRPAPQVKTRV